MAEDQQIPLRAVSLATGAHNGPLSAPHHQHHRHGHHPHHLRQSRNLSSSSSSNSHHLSFERKCLLAATSATVIGLILMLVAVSTDYWLIVTNQGGSSIIENDVKLFRLYSHSGIWRVCNIDFRNDTIPFRVDTSCRRHILFPSENETDRFKSEFDETSLAYTRSEVAFSTIGIVLMLLGQGFAFYSFKERRYMFKRLTACIHMMSAICILICIEVMVSSISYHRAHLPGRYPAKAISHFGFSFVLACVTCAAFFAAGLTFLAFSGKRKSNPLKHFAPPLDDNQVIADVDADGDEEAEQERADAAVVLGR